MFLWCHKYAHLLLNMILLLLQGEKNSMNEENNESPAAIATTTALHEHELPIVIACVDEKEVQPEVPKNTNTLLHDTVCQVESSSLLVLNYMESDVMDMTNISELVCEDVLIEYMDIDPGNVETTINSDFNTIDEMPEETAGPSDAIQRSQDDKCVEELYEIQSETTKTGELRKRRKFKLNPEQRKSKKREILKMNHKVLPGCGNDCNRKCSDSFTEMRRIMLNEDFNNMEETEKKSFILLSTRRTIKAKNTVCSESRRKNSVGYFFKTDDGDNKQVCKTFYLTTLGFNKTNDRMIQNAIALCPKSSVKARDLIGEKENHHPIK